MNTSQSFYSQVIAKINQHSSATMIVAAVAIAYLVKNQVAEDPLELFYDEESELIKKIIEKSQLNRMAFKPSIWIRNAHVQTLMNPFNSRILQKKMPFEFEREIFLQEDGGSIALDWVESIPTKECNKNVIAIVPGLTSNNNECYVLNLLSEAKKRNFHAVVINYRGASGLQLTSPKLYCSTSTQDIRDPLLYISQKYCVDNNQNRTKDLFVIGNSLGGNILSNLLGEEQSTHYIKAACCVQPSMRMWICEENIRDRLYGFYNRVLGGNLNRKMMSHMEHLKDHFLTEHELDLIELMKTTNTILDFDERITSKAFGYGDRKNYYNIASPINRIPHIKTPTMFLMAKDDVIMGAKSIDYETCVANPNVLLAVTEHGGHLGYFESSFSTQQWFVKPVFEFIMANIDQ